MENIFVFVSGGLVTALIDEKGYSKTDFAKMVGISRQTISGWRGKPVIKMKKKDAERVVKALGVSLDRILIDKTSSSKEGKASNKSFKDEIFEGDYMGVHKRIWIQLEGAMVNDRKLLISLAETLNNLTKSGGDQ